MEEKKSTMYDAVMEVEAVPTPTCAGTVAIPTKRKMCIAADACSTPPKSFTKSEREL